MTEIEVPEALAASTVAREGAAGREWIRDLPGVVAELCERWGLAPDGPPTHGGVALVVPVRGNGVERVLKVSWIDESSRQEALALRIWEGRGAVRLVDEDAAAGALLLERLDHRRTLESVPIPEALTVAGGLLRRLAVPAPSQIRTLAEEIARLRRELPELWEMTERPFRRSLLDRVLGLMDELGPGEAGRIVDVDLHYENVLGAEREPWLAIDPKIVAGDLEYGTAQLLWNRFDELEGAEDLDARVSLLSEAAALDPERVRGWSFVRLVEYRLWALKVGLTEDAGRARRLVDWLT